MPQESYNDDLQGIVGIEDNGNRTIDINENSNDADKDGVQTDDAINGGDGSVEEDPYADMHDDGSIANIQRP